MDRTWERRNRRAIVRAYNRFNIRKHLKINDIMEEQKTVAVEMTAEQKAAFERFQQEEQRRAAQQRASEMRREYLEMVDREIGDIMPELMQVSEDIARAKRKAYDNFRTIVEMKEEIFRLRKDRDLEVKSHTFTNSKGDMRITLGVYQVDNYRDTAEAGIEIVKEYISSLAKDAESQALVDMVLRLLAKDAKGTLKASRIIQLRRLADRSGNARFIEGVQTIEEAYEPVASKTYVKAEVKGGNGEWKSIPLGMTEA